METSNPLIQAAGHLLVVDFPQERLWINGDAVRLAQLLSNLLNNASNYTDSGGNLAVKMRRDGAQVEITVKGQRHGHGAGSDTAHV